MEPALVLSTTTVTAKKHLADVLIPFALLSFLIDQVQFHCCALFQRARKHQKRNLYVWEAMRSLFRQYRIDNGRDDAHA